MDRRLETPVLHYALKLLNNSVSTLSEKLIIITLDIYDNCMKIEFSFTDGGGEGSRSRGNGKLTGNLLVAR